MSQAALDLSPDLTMPPFSIDQGFVHARLPNAGLGNKLFVWARARLFADLNDLPLVVTGWTTFQLAPLLKSGDLRWYWNYFQSVDEVGWLRRMRLEKRMSIVHEPLLQAGTAQQGCIHVFREVPHWSDYFASLKPHRERVRAALLDMLTPARRAELGHMRRPAVCIQVRMGDFRPLATGEDFSKTGQTRTPLSFFKELIEGIRHIHGSELPVTIVTDGTAAQLQELLALPAVNLGPPNSKIVDILMMASAGVLVPSAGSTFGYWGGFLGDCALITHPSHTHGSIRPAECRDRFFEGPVSGPVEGWDARLKENISSIRA
jgi:hypothetical protein